MHQFPIAFTMMRIGRSNTSDKSQRSWLANRRRRRKPQQDESDDDDVQQLAALQEQQAQIREELEGLVLQMEVLVEQYTRQLDDMKQLLEEKELDEEESRLKDAEGKRQSRHV